MRSASKKLFGGRCISTSATTAGAAKFTPAQKSEQSFRADEAVTPGKNSVLCVTYGHISVLTVAVRMIEAKTPVGAAVHGAAIGGGLGLACSADLRVGSSETRMTANFSQLEFHHSFGLTLLLPPIVGQQRVLELLLTGKRTAGDEAHCIGLLDRFVDPEKVRTEAHRMKAEIASSAPLAVATMRARIADRSRQATDHENAEQSRLRLTDNLREGVTAAAERRSPSFLGC